MAAITPTRGRLRRLAELHPEHGRVLTLYINLDPSEFATPDARATQITSLLDEAAREVDALDGLDHDELVALRADIERLRAELDPVGLGEGGARGLAVFACGPANLLATFPLPHPLESRVTIDSAPEIAPLAAIGDEECWCVVLVNSRHGRIFLGAEHGFEEVADARDDTHGQHQRGGWSQRRYEDSVDEEVRAHLDHVCDDLLRLLKRRPIDRLVIGGPTPLDDALAERLHPYLRERLSGRVDCDVESASADVVLQAAGPVFDHARRAREHAAMERFRAGIGRGDGRAAAGPSDVFDALEQRRVEVLLLEPPPASGWAEHVDEAIERALAQSADVLVVRDHADLGAHSGIGALLRF